VRLLDHGEHEGAPFIVYELLEGESLASALERGPLPEARALAITAALLASLSEAHRAGVVHRDVKPANVFLTRDGQTKLLDFGVAASLTPSTTGRSLTATGEIVGTPPYLAPEQLMSGALSPATDLYAVALVLAEMLNGKRVFEGPPLAVMAKKARSPVPPFDAALLLSRFGNTLLAATAKEPSARFQTAEMMLGALTGTGARKRSSYRLPIAIGAAVLLLAGGSALGYQLTRPKASRTEDGKRERVAKYCPGIDGIALPKLGKRFPEWKIVKNAFETTHNEIVFGEGEKVMGYVHAYNNARGAKALRTALEVDGAHLDRDSNVDVLIGDRSYWHVKLPEAETTALIDDLCP
jgi:hypothetical protein